MKRMFHKLGLILPLILAATALMAQDAAAPAPGKLGDILSTLLIGVAAAVVLFAIGTLYRLLTIMLKVQQIRIYQERGLEAFLKEVKKPSQTPWQRLMAQWTKAVPVEKETDILFDHDFDGIRELDNRLPPWWVALFYATIAFAGIYMIYYHFAGIGPSSREKYEQEMKDAEKAVAAYLSTQANLVDETNVTALTEDADLAVGKTIWSEKCVACHGALGEGGIGPNMTDAYWLHGGRIQDIFKVVKYGVLEKGMQAWKEQLTASEMQKVSSYILSLQGTNPPNGKEPQGDLYENTPAADQQQAPPADTTAGEATPAVGMN